MGSRVLLWKEPKKTKQKEGKRNPQSCLLLLLLLHNTPANVIISVHVREEILGHRLEGKYMLKIRIRWIGVILAVACLGSHAVSPRAFFLLHRKPLISYRTFECGIEVVTSERGTREDDVSKETREIRANMFVEFCSGRNFRTRSSYLSLSRVIPSRHFSWNLSRCVAVTHSLR